MYAIAIPGPSFVTRLCEILLSTPATVAAVVCVKHAVVLECMRCIGTQAASSRNSDGCKVGDWDICPPF